MSVIEIVNVKPAWEALTSGAHQFVVEPFISGLVFENDGKWIAQFLIDAEEDVRGLGAFDSVESAKEAVEKRFREIVEEVRLESMICQRPGCKQPFSDHGPRGYWIYDCDAFCETAPPEHPVSDAMYRADPRLMKWISWPTKKPTDWEYLEDGNTVGCVCKIARAGSVPFAAYYGSGCDPINRFRALEDAKRAVVLAHDEAISDLARRNGGVSCGSRRMKIDEFERGEDGAK